MGESNQECLNSTCFVSHVVHLWLCFGLLFFCPTQYTDHHTGKLQQLEGQGEVFLLAATLRPETMYGQTNAWVLPDGQYGVFKGLNNELYVMTERSARNLSYQERLPVTGEPERVMTLTGHDLIGTPIRVCGKECRVVCNAVIVLDAVCMAVF